MGVDMGIDVTIRVWTDSDTGRSVASRRGLGRLKHVELRFLWVQEIVKSGRLRLMRVKGTENIADHLTKSITGGEMARMMAEAGATVMWKEESGMHGGEEKMRCRESHFGAGSNDGVDGITWDFDESGDSGRERGC
jgi:hypothetical protein